MSVLNLDSVHLRNPVRIGRSESLFFRPGDYRLILRDHDVVIITELLSLISVHVPISNVLSYAVAKDTARETAGNDGSISSDKSPPRNPQTSRARAKD